jgi:TPR repeat protein
LPSEIVADLLRRGDAMLAIGDVSSARLLYNRAAVSGDARAATQLAKTYDPLFLTKIGAWGIPTDATTAAKWYRKAAALGDAEAAERLKHLAEAGQ